MTDARLKEIRQRRGVAVRCVVCGLMKKPVGRSAPVETASSYCDHECSGYYADPQPGPLWPGETSTEYGYPVGTNASEPIAEPEKET